MDDEHTSKQVEHRRVPRRSPLWSTPTDVRQYPSSVVVDYD